MKILILIAAALVIALTIIPAIVDGQRRFRWGEDTQVREIADRLDQFPKQIRGWETTSQSELTQTEMDMLVPFTTINRVYHNPAKQLQANVFILFGPTGPTAVHTPDICFSSRDYRKMEKRKAVSVSADSRGSKSFLTRFQSRNVDNHYLKSWYAWTNDGTWQAPEKSRYFFAKSRYLVKVQIVARYSNREDMENDEATRQFVADIQRELRNRVF